MHKNMTSTWKSQIMNLLVLVFALPTTMLLILPHRGVSGTSLLQLKVRSDQFKNVLKTAVKLLYYDSAISPKNSLEKISD